MDIFSTTKVGSVLGTLTSSSSASNMAELTKAAGQQRLQTQVNSVSDSYSGQFRDISDQVTKLQTVQTTISAAIDSLKGARSSANSLASLMSQMSDTVASTNNASSTDLPFIAQQFQAQMATLRSMTQSQAGNMLSGADQRISYDTSPTGGSVDVLGANLGAAYTIVDPQGRTWAPNTYATALIAYTSYPETPANVASGFNGGTVLNSRSGDNITFTINANTASPQTLNGVITSKGAGVQDSWFYDDFTTQSGRDQAASDLKAAQATAKTEAMRYDASAAMAQYYYDKIDLAVGTLTAQQQTLTEEQGKKIQDLQDKFNQSQAALALAMQSVALSGISLAAVLPEGQGIFATDTSSTSTFSIFA